MSQTIERGVSRQLRAYETFDAIRRQDAGGRIPTRRQILRGMWRRLTRTARRPEHRAMRRDMLRRLMVERERLLNLQQRLLG
jgi:hypothetical protein